MTGSRSNVLLRLLASIVSDITEHIRFIVMSPDTVSMIVRKSGMEIIKINGKETTGNLYYDRDILLLLKLEP